MEPTRTTTTGADLVSVIPESALVVDLWGTVLAANQRALELLGRSRAAVVEKRVGELLPGFPQLSGSDDVATAAGRHEVDLGGLRLRIGRLSETFRSGRESSFLVVVQDLRELAALRTERDRLLRLATAGEVVPAVLHELRNPLATISTAVELLIEESTDNAGLQKELHAILTEIRRMSNGLQGLGAVGGSLQSSSNVAVDQSLREAAQVLRRRIEVKGVSLRCRVPDLPLLPVEPGSLRALVFNLLNNAVAACRPGDEILLRARLDRREQELVITIEDTGCGMTPEVLARCTELFFTTRSRGSGIGLALCRELARSIGGRLDIRSEAGRGTEVAVHLPLARASRASGASRSPQSHPNDEPYPSEPRDRR